MMRDRKSTDGELAPPGPVGRRLAQILTAALVLCGGLAPADQPPPAATLAELVRAGALHETGLGGRGVTLAVVDGPWPLSDEVRYAADGRDRLLAVHEEARAEAPAPGLAGAVSPDGALEAMLSSRRDAAGGIVGVAPEADLVLVRALAADGTGRVEEIARGIEWVVAQRQRFGIRILLLPLGQPPRVDAAAAPLARPLREAREAGIAVVVPAGHGGPGPATLVAPGDLPQVLTVGAAAADGAGFTVAAYSASGPTLEGIVKPQVVAPSPAPGAAVAAGPGPGLAARVSGGTAVAAAAVAGVAALLLEAHPWLTPDEVELRLLATARPLGGPDGSLLPAWRQGAGLVDAAAAVRALPGAAEALRGMTWSDRALRQPTGTADELRGITWSDEALRAVVGSHEALRGMTWSD